MKIFKIPLIALIISTLFISCFEDQDDNAIATSDISEFVWKGMNAFYLYKDFKPDLANDRFTSNEAFENYLNNYSGPEDLFDDLIYERQTIDRFSVLVNNYIALEQLFDGITKNNGMEFGLFRFSESDSNLYGYVRYILPNTDAELKGLQRGDLFNAVNGTQLTVSNWRSLLGTDSYTLNLAVYNDNGTADTSDDSVESTSDIVTLNKAPYTENPIYIHNVITVGSNNVGYLMYNGFTGTDEFDSQLNSVFGEFKAAGITDLVLDLRYNGGGSVATATWLASMITGQFTGDTFFTEQYNSDIQSQIIAENPSFLINPFVAEMIKRNTDNDIIFQQVINHANLNRVYVLTTGNTASASELVINGLKPYIDVVQIGGTTVGKYQASTTLYDSDNFRRANANPNHTYAIQPLIFKSLNANGVTDYDSGLVPDIAFGERFNNLGILGDINEPYLAAALMNIEDTGRFMLPQETNLKELSGSTSLEPLANDMYTDKKLPDFLIGKFKIQ